MEVDRKVAGRNVVGGVDTHKDLHVAAVVDELDRVLGSRCFPTTRQGYKQMLAWMRSLGRFNASASRPQAPTEPGCSGTCSTPASRCWRSRHRIRTIAASAA